MVAFVLCIFMERLDSLFIHTPFCFVSLKTYFTAFGPI